MQRLPGTRAGWSVQPSASHPKDSPKIDPEILRAQGSQSRKSPQTVAALQRSMPAESPCALHPFPCSRSTRAEAAGSHLVRNDSKQRAMSGFGSARLPASRMPGLGQKKTPDSGVRDILTTLLAAHQLNWARALLVMVRSALAQQPAPVAESPSGTHHQPTATR